MISDNKRRVWSTRDAFYFNFLMKVNKSLLSEQDAALCWSMRQSALKLLSTFIHQFSFANLLISWLFDTEQTTVWIFMHQRLWLRTNLYNTREENFDLSLNIEGVRYEHPVSHLSLLMWTGPLWLLVVALSLSIGHIPIISSLLIM